MRRPAFIAMAIVLAACSTTAEDTTATSTGPATTTPIETSAGSAAGTTPAAAADDVLDISYPTDGGRMYDPHLAPNPFAAQFMYPTYDTLFQLDENGDAAPMLATGYDFSDDLLTLTIDLREGVVFHDGTAFDADAVKANLERALTDEASQVRPDVSSIDSIEVSSTSQVVLHLNRPGAALPAILSERAGMMISPAAFGPDLALQPVGAGPYQVIEHEPGVNVVYQRFADYWDEDFAGIDHINLVMEVNSDTRLAALQSGQVDATALNINQIGPAEAAGLTVEETPSDWVFLLYLNMGEGPLAVPEVRQAMMQAIDREGIAASLFEGRCTPTVQVLPPSNWAQNPDIDIDRYPYDVAAAQALLEEAGYGDGFEMSAMVLNNPFYVAGAEIVQAQLAQIGITLALTPLEPQLLVPTFVVQKEADAYYTNWVGAADPSKTIGALLTPASPFNPGGLEVPGVLAGLGQASSTLDKAARTAGFNAAMTAATDAAMHLPICSPPTVTAHNGSVDGLVPDQSGFFHFRNVSLAG